MEVLEEYVPEQPEEEDCERKEMLEKVVAIEFEPLQEKTNNLSSRQCPTQTGLYSHRSRLEA